MLKYPLRIVWRTLNDLHFYLYVVFVSRKFDLIHIHTSYLLSFFLPFKAKIIEFHGSDVRGKPSRRWWIDRKVTGLFLHFNHVKEANEPLKILHVFDCASVS